jgi:hypothetical protein
LKAGPSGVLEANQTKPPVIGASNAIQISVWRHPLALRGAILKLHRP